MTQYKVIFFHANTTGDIAEVVLASYYTTEGEQNFVLEKTRRGFKIYQGPFSF